ncbi:hypothetical protein DESC_780026 [Desulfosarcina cetonica]|nr:hypothetical protein DESC_780026 [Desulfosarcina cetonica]
MSAISAAPALFTIWLCRDGLHVVDHVVGDVGVGVDLLDIVAVIHGVQEFEHAFGFAAGKRAHVLGQHGHFFIRVGNFGAVQGLLDRIEIFGRGNDFESVIFFANIFSAGLKGHLHEVFLVYRRFVHAEVALFIEHPGHTAVFPHVAAVFVEDMANLGHGAVLVVGQGFHQNGCSTGAVTFIGTLFVADPLELTGTLFDGPLDVILGHVFGLGRHHRRTQARIGIDIAAARTGSHGNFLDQFGEDLPPFGILGALAVFDGRPLIMSRHSFLLSYLTDS